MDSVQFPISAARSPEPTSCGKSSNSLQNVSQIPWGVWSLTVSRGQFLSVSLLWPQTPSPMGSRALLPDFAGLLETRHAPCGHTTGPLPAREGRVEKRHHRALPLQRAAI